MWHCTSTCSREARCALVAVAALVLTVLGHVRVALQIGGSLDRVVARSFVVAGLVQAER